MLCVLLGGCTTATPTPPTTLPSPDTPEAQLAKRSTIAHPKALGLSGSCTDAAGMWVVTERDGLLLQVADDGTVARSLTVLGIPEGVDLEGLACGGGFFYVSTENEDEGRTEDEVYVLEPQGNEARVVDTITLSYPEGVRAGKNQGLEGLCVAGDWLVAASEALRTTSGGKREAPILKISLTQGANTLAPHWVPLTSSTGKLAGMDCRLRAEEIEVFAIERHYSVARVLRFTLGAINEKPEVLPLEHLVRESDNFEAIVVDEEGRVRLVNDNQYTTITGPSETTVLERIERFAVTVP